MARPDSPGEAGQPRGVRSMPTQEIFEIVSYQICASCILGRQNVTEIELFVIMKLDVASSAVSPF